MAQKYSLFHGTEEERLKQWHTPYADMLAQHGPVLDVGCGPGYFADLLRERGRRVSGWISMRRWCRRAGHADMKRWKVMTNQSQRCLVASAGFTSAT